jgi:hypothetical protein
MAAVAAKLAVIGITHAHHGVALALGKKRWGKRFCSIPCRDGANQGSEGPPHRIPGLLWMPFVDVFCVRLS